ncbi:hypothetical protein ACWGTO_07540 [Mesorhizobium sp. PL10]
MNTPFQEACELEEPLTTATDLMKALAFIAETLGPDVSSVVQRLAWMAIEQIGAAEECRSRLCQITRREEGPKP